MQTSKSILVKLLTLICALCCVFALIFGLAACSDGTDGADGIGISSVVINDNGELVITYTNGDSVNLGVVKGADGAQGEKGEQGDTGAQGEKGEQGETGAQGEKGEQGETGAQGEKGDTGRGIANIVLNEAGDKLVITYDDNTSEEIALPAATTQTCEHEYYDVVLTEANCQVGGVILSVCTKNCGSAIINFTAVNPDNHTYNISVVMPTCEDDGYLHFECKGGDKSYDVTLDELKADTEGVYTAILEEKGVTIEDLEKLGHDYQVTLTKPTCESDGYLTYTCKNDKTHTYKVTAEEVAEKPEDYEEYLDGYTSLKATGHSGIEKAEKLTVVDEGANICVDGGQILLVCSYCEEYVYQAEEVKPAGHKVTADWEVTKEPTTEEAGVLSGHCSVCETTATVVLPILNEKDYKKTEIVKATCEEKGEDAYTITIGEWEGTFKVVTTDFHYYNNNPMDLTKSYTADEVEISFANVEATCEEGVGKGMFTCQVCGKQFLVNLIGDHKINYDDLREHKDATCTEEGYDIYGCSINPEHTVKVTIAKIPHTYEISQEEKKDEDGNVVKDDGGNTIIEITFKCTVCGDKYTIEGYDVQEVTVDATCDAPGYTTYTYKYKDADNIEQEGKFEVEIPQLSHENTKGTVYYGNEYNKDGKPFTVSEVDEVFANFAGSCLEEGFGCIICEHCGKSFLVKIIGDHVFGEGEVVEPTCEDEGYTLYTCTICGATEKRDEVDAKGHQYGDPEMSWNEDKTELTVTFTCEICGDKKEITGIKDFELLEDKSKASTCEEEGYEVYQYTYTAPDGTQVTETFEKKLPKAAHKNSKGTEYYGEYNKDGNPYTVSEVDEVFANFTGSCLEEGYGYIVCEHCGKSFLVIIIGDHDFESENWITVPATCEEDGYQYKHCTVCKEDIINPDYSEKALGHKYDIYKVTEEATEESEGTLVVYCSNDNNHTIVYVLPAINDKDYKVTDRKTATCSEEGYTKYTYEVKDADGNVVYTYTATVSIPMTEHQEGKIYTWTLNGYRYTGYRCTNCDNVIVTEKVAIEDTEVSGD